MPNIRAFSAPIGTVSSVAPSAPAEAAQHDPLCLPEYLREVISSVRNSSSRDSDFYVSEVAIVQQAIAHPNVDRCLVGELLELLVSRGQVYEEASAFATDMMNSPDPAMRRKGLDLFLALVREGEAILPAIAAAERGVLDREVYADQYGAAIRLLKELVRRGEAIPQAIAAAEVASRSEDVIMRILGALLFQTLVSEGHVDAYRPATVFAQQDVASMVADDQKSSGRPDVRELFVVVGLFEVLVRQGQGYSEARSAAEAIIAYTYPYALTAAEAVDPELFLDEQGIYNEAVRLRYQTLQDTKRPVAPAV